MAKSLTIDIDSFKNGLQLLDDDSMALVGSARKMNNILITDRGGISPRPGTEILGSYSTSTAVSTGFYVFKKAFGAKEIPMRAYDDEVEAYDATSGAWFRVKDGFTAAQRFGFLTNLVNEDNEDYVYFCNRYEPYQRWSGQIAHLNGALSGAETSVVVDSVLEEDIFESQTATSSSATTLTVSSAPFIADQWINFYVHVTSGAYDGYISKITDNTTDTLTFASMGGDPGNCTFEIRQTKFPASGIIIYNGTALAYTAIPQKDRFTVSSAHAASDGTPLTLVPDNYVGAPRGNRMDSLIGRAFVGNVRSAMSRDSGGALQGSNSAGSVFVAKLNDPTDFGFSATRVASEGDIISMPYGGGDITDIAVREDVAYVYKKSYIEAIQYSQDSDDIAIRQPLKPGVGSVSRVIRGKDDHYFMTVDKQFTSIGRVLSKDTTVQTQNIGLPIKRYLDNCVFDSSCGIEYRNRVFLSCKSDNTYDKNNITIVWNKSTGTFEGIWSLGAEAFDIYNDELYYIQAQSPNAWKMFTGYSDKLTDTSKFSITADWQSNFFNLLPIKANSQACNSVAIEGYITANSEFEFSIYKDFATDSSLSFTFGGDEETFLMSNDISDFLGNTPLGLNPIGTIDNPDADGRRRFSFTLYFPYIYGQYFSLGVGSAESDAYWEVIRISLGLTENVSSKQLRIKNN